MDLQNPPIPDPSAHSRRGFLRRTGGATALAVVGASGGASAAVDESGEFTDDPYSLGVASGDPLPDSVVLWTRLAPNPYEVGGGMPDESTPVQWTVATDEGMTDVVQTGTASADPSSAHSVHVDVQGLRPATEYYYRFEAGGVESEVGRTKTAPAADASPDELRFAFASCQAWYNGFYTAYRYMADEEFDFVVHLGDYIYEYGIDANGGERGVSVPQAYREEPTTLDRYRLQYGLYKSDEDLKAAHASAPWLVTRDDHEVDNNWAGDTPQDPDEQDLQSFLERRAAAFKAYYEHMPFRPAQMPDGPDQKLYREFTFGDLAEVNVLDTREYRTDQACDDGFSVVDCEARLDDERTILGDAQEEWLVDNLESSDATWDVLANQVPFAAMDFEAGPEEGYRMDQWDGYVADRDTVLDAFDAVDNPVVITGDFHSNFANEVVRDYRNDDSPTVATEFVATSISSGGDGADMDEFGRQVLADNDNVRYYNNQRGYVACRLTPDEWETNFRVVEYVTEPDAPVRTDASFSVAAGDPGVRTNVPQYQVDFVAGDPIENLSADTLYAEQDRLLRYAFGTPGEGITEKDTAWPSAEVRDCVDYGHITEHDDGTASVTFTVADDCEGVVLSLAVHSMPDETFDAESVAHQTLLESATESFGPGEHTISVPLPDGAAE
ncbi:alkaline phosphatase D family protein [Candidatus Halobonum tyrrellensis]|uniref:Alkaline phosphatase D n=1 Tax=Candidatus Halobonum tyrrellensis G22 TaxID=1324957 RepID=V4J466_9EURY|nr:alkaline phosphatase D family protein [Candidatus Halobonum tyrrellensis]ESP90167.1 alkaline phosphatase D [Candidatus Halobonum tyrrellensis G22]